ncbi:translocon-associated protein trap gamma subunit [Anaeramoeba ignava]|uniref:Translocon-associated protein trap gamma subunit n=1 Tax=Anaeramoeba ignava TaxID=1746090 RepID=A0A9Q0LFB2_ANAIG|nr:translocon-associated protein trap gamma subunit [Anaeramoeba ignava]|eukprot:Anaeramoba_ignava/a354251_33.p1 GENE.a354251_33~~a354251_33.p1  ORF type:complete len:186 (+),score=47.17 a354251_33:25-582(+)
MSKTKNSQLDKDLAEFDKIIAQKLEDTGVKSTKKQQTLYFATGFIASHLINYIFITIFQLKFLEWWLLFIFNSIFSGLLLVLPLHNTTFSLRFKMFTNKEQQIRNKNKKENTDGPSQAKKDILNLIKKEAISFSIFYNLIFYIFVALIFIFYIFGSFEPASNLIASSASSIFIVGFVSTLPIKNQ